MKKSKESILDSERSRGKYELPLRGYTLMAKMDDVIDHLIVSRESMAGNVQEKEDKSK